MPLLEPALPALSNPFMRYFLATRPPFLSVTLCAALIGITSAHNAGLTINIATAVITVIFALIVHAGINVLNDYYDELNGTDRLNTDRVFPFTGGSRFIQNNVMSARATAIFGALLMLVAMIGGFWLTWRSNTGLLLIGALGMLIGWAYSAPPLKLNSRGWGELCVAAGFSLIAVGADYVQRGAFSAQPLIAVLCYALLVTNILYINQFPDYRADLTAGKHHWVVRLGPQHARWGYFVVAGVAYISLGVFIATKHLPPLAAIGLLPVLLSFNAGRILLAHATTPKQLEPALKMTIAAAVAHGLLLSLALTFTQQHG